MDELRTLLRDAEEAQHRTFETATNDLRSLSRLEDPVLLLLDVLCQLETKESRQETLQVLRRLFATCSEHIYPFEESSIDIPKSHNVVWRENVMLKTLLDTIKTLSSRDKGDAELVQALVDMTQELCLQSINVAGVVALFNFLRLSESPARRLVLQMQKSLVDMDTLPRAVFIMRGSNAGLIVPSEQQLFTKKGYSCSFGILLNANATDAAFYSFRGQNGQGVSAILHNNTLLLKMVARQGNVQQVKVPFSNYVKKMKKEWVHLCIVHAKKMVFKDKVTVYVDGESVFDGNLGYPDPLMMLGGKFCIGREPHVEGLHGKLWGPTLFGVALSAAEVQRLHWRAHWKNDLNSVAAENAGQTDKSKICFCYDARSCDLEKRICYDVSGNDCDGSLEPGTSIIVTQSFAHALDSVGGCACFLLLLLDQIPEAADFHPVHEFGMMDIADLVAFVGAGLSHSTVCCSHFVRLEGVKVVEFILQSISPSYLSVSLLKGVVSVLEAMINFLESDDKITEYINCLLFLNRNWFFAPFETQEVLLSEVLPRYLQIVQAATLRERNRFVETRLPRSPGKSLFSRAPSLVESWSLNANNQVDISFFCRLLSQVYVLQASSDKDGPTTGQMSSQQLAQLHKLVVQKLVDPLLFPTVQDSVTDQWRQLMGFLFRHCDRDSVHTEELIQYVTQNLALTEACKTTSGLPARQLQVTTNIRKLSKGSVRIFWKLMSSSHYNVRLAALRLFEVYTNTEKVVLTKKDMLMLYWSFQGHTLSSELADLLLDIVIGRKPSSQGNLKVSVDICMGIFARMSFIPIVLLGLIHNANFDVQARILAEIRAQMVSPPMGENVKEILRSWPSWLSRLRSLALEAAAATVSSNIEKTREASFIHSEKLNKACGILSDDFVSTSEKVEALQAVADCRDVAGCDFALSLLQDRNQSEVVTRAVITMVTEHFPQRLPQLIGKIVNQMIVDIIVYCILHIRNGWMHFLEFYFWHCRIPPDLCSLTAVICEQVLEQANTINSMPQIEIIWENLCQVAAVVSQSSLVASKMAEALKINDVILSLGQQRILTRNACALWQFVLPHWDRVNWDAMASNMIQTIDYGSDGTSEETYIFTHLVATCTRATFLALQTIIQQTKISQSSSKNDDELAQKIHDIVKLSELIDTQLGWEKSEKLNLHMYTLDSCFTFLEASLEAQDIDCAHLLAKVMVTLAHTALDLYDCNASTALTKTLQIMSSTDLSFFDELSQVRELLMLWIHCRQNHHVCCDSELFDTVSHQLNADFIRNWMYVMKDNSLDFNPYLVQQYASSQAELLGAELQECEDLWKQIIDVNEAADVDQTSEREMVNESRLVELKRSAQKFATSVRKLLARSSREPDTSPLSRENGTAEKQVHSRNRSDGTVWKIDSRENNLRMRLRIKKVTQDYRARNLSYEYRTSSFSDTDCTSGKRLSRQFRMSTEKDLVDLEHSWRSDAGSNYSDFLADAQMRSAIIRSLSNPDVYENAGGKVSDDDELEGGESDFYDAGENDDQFQLLRSLQQEASESEMDASSLSSPQPIADSTDMTEPESAAVASSESSFFRSPLALPPRSGLSLGASVLTVVGGMAEFLQKSVQDAKDAVEYNVDNLYTTKDAVSEEAQALMQEMALYAPKSYVMPMESLRRDNRSEEPSSNLMELKLGPDKSEYVSESSLPSPTTQVDQKKGHGLATESVNASTKLDLQVDAQLMRHMHVVEGKLILTRSSVQFVAERVVDESDSVVVEKKAGIPVDQAWQFLFKRRRWKIDDIVSLYRRRYLLKPTALELFIFSTRKNYFFNMTSESVVLFHEALMTRKPLLLKRDPNVRRLRHPSSLFRNSQFTTRWIHHEISTFEYLMWLNTIAGRTYNDLTQYPVFPWILSDYESTKLDLGRKAAYRDLTKPMGALEPTRLKFYVDRYNAFDDPDMPKFMYGTHYSNIGAILYYLIRLEPFTSYAQSLQGGKFDHSDRLFHSIAETWHNCLTDYSDLKELTPEWFYLPDFLVNRNGLDFGTRQNGTNVNDVVLPPWARSPEDFVMKNLVALESEYVSANIHHWIDLVFGCKQRGTAAVEANNVFFYLTYEGMVDIDSITDPIVKSSMQSQIAHFGQTPTQVIRDPHPQRRPLGSVMAARGPDTLHLSVVDHNHAMLNVPHEAPIVLISILSETSQLTCMDRNGMLSSHRFGRRVSRPRQYNHTAHKSKGPSSMSLSGDQTNEFFELQDRKSRKVFGDKRLLTTQPCISNTMTFLHAGMILCTVGHHDFSARFYSTMDGTLLYRLLQHQSVVSSVSTTHMGTLLALGCADGTISVWKVASMNSTLVHSLNIFRGTKTVSKPVHANDYSADQVLLGHNAQINCVSVSDELGVCVSGSASNECLVHNLEDGLILHSYDVPGNLEPGILLLALSSVGHVVLQSMGTGSPMLYSFHLNGSLLAQVSLGIHSMTSLSICARYSKVIVSNNEQALVMTAHSLDDEHILLDQDTYGEISAQSLTRDETHVIFGVGIDKIVSIPLFSLQSRLHQTEV